MALAVSLNKRIFFGRTTQHRFDCYDRVTESTWPDRRTTNIRYANHSAAMLLVCISPKNYTVAGQCFDELGRVTRRMTSGQTALQSFQIDPVQITLFTGNQCFFVHESVFIMTCDTTNEYQYDSQTSTILRFWNEQSINEFQYFLVIRKNIRINDDVFVLTYLMTENKNLKYIMTARVDLNICDNESWNSHSIMIMQAVCLRVAFEMKLTHAV